MAQSTSTKKNTSTTKKNSGTKAVSVPKGVKQPADRQDKGVKAEATDEPVVFEHDGREYTIDARTLRDVRVLEVIGDLQSGEEYLLPRYVKLILGPQQYQAWARSVEEDGGFVDMQQLFKLAEVMDEAMGNFVASSGS